MSTKKPRSRGVIPSFLFLICVLIQAACGGGPDPAVFERAASRHKSGEPVPTSSSPPGNVSCPPYDPSIVPAPLPVAETAALGTIPGSFSVSSTGAASYTVPLAVPPGIAGMEPSLAVTYSSSGGDGPLGVGFALQGLSAITRCPSNLAQDHALRPVRYDEADRLCLDGARLVQIASAFDFDGSGTAEYRTFPDTFTKIVAHYPPGSDRKRGPRSFEVFTKSGRVALYGSTADSRAMARNQVIASWWMSEEHDRRGNAVDYQYLNDVDPADGHTLEIVPQRIRYTRHDPDPPARSVDLEYRELPEGLAHVSWSGGMRLRRSRLLSRVRMTAPGGEAVRTYVLDYQDGAATGRSLLASLSECAGDGSGACKPPTRFEWSSHPSNITTKVTAPLYPADHQGGPNFSPLWLLADVNGDGLEDIVMSLPSEKDHTIDEWWVSLNGGGSFGTPFVWIAFPYPQRNKHRNWTPTAIDLDQDGLTDIFLDHPNLSSAEWPRYRWLRAKPDFTFELMETAVPHPPRVDYENTAPDPPILGNYKIDAHRFTRLGDVNGDGVADLIQCVDKSYEVPAWDPPDPSLGQAKWTVNLWSPSAPSGPGFDPTPVPIDMLDGLDCMQGLISVYIVDIDGDGASEILVPFKPTCANCDGTYGALRYVGSGWDYFDTTIPLQWSWRGLHFLDVNGDGLPDPIFTGFLCSGGAPWEAPHCPDPYPFTFHGNDGSTSTWPSDVPVVLMNHGPGALTGNPEPFLGYSTAFPGKLTDWYGDSAMSIDWNGDGQADLLLPIQGHCASADGDDTPCWVVLQTEPNGRAALTAIDTRIPAILEGSVDALPWYQPRVTDVNGDGRHDLIVADPDHGGAFFIYQNDGPQDLLVSITDGLNPLDPGDQGFLPTVSIEYGGLVDGAATKKLPPGSPARDHLTYIARSDANNDCTYPRACLTGTERVVASYALNNGASKPRTFHVQYRDGRSHRLGRGFLGFGMRIVTDADTGSGTAELFDNITHDAVFDTFPYAGHAVQTWAWSPAHHTQANPTQIELGYRHATFQTVPTNLNATYFTLPVISRVEREQGTFKANPAHTLFQYVQATEAAPAALLGRSWTVVAAYDDLGNVLEESRHTEGVDVQDTVTRVVSNDPGSWLIGLVTSEEACSTALGRTQCRTAQSSYNQYGEETAAEIGDLSDPGTQLSLGYGRDRLGHVVSTTADDAFGGHRSSCVSYDAEGRFPFAVRNGLGHTSYLAHDRGLGVTTAAIEPNGLVTTWEHDGFGRITREHRPDGTATSYTFTRARDGGPQGDWYNIKVTTAADGGEHRAVELDALGRVVHTWTKGPEVAACDPWVCVNDPQYETEVLFDDLGRPTRVSLPWMTGDPASKRLYHAYEYDAPGRLEKHTTPWGLVTTFAYTGNVTTAADWLGSVTAEVDAAGRVVKTTDRKGGAVETTYGPFSLPWSVTRYGSETTTMERDAYGRVLVETDLDRGVTKTSYDGFGEVRAVDDAIPRHHAFTYDVLGRLVQREDSDGTTIWEYDTTAHGVGRLAKVTSPAGHVERYSYDSLARPSMTELDLDGETFKSSVSYDAFGRPSIVVYPQAPGVAPLVIRHDYDSAGHLLTVRDNATGKPYWQLGYVDGAGRATLETLGDGTSVHHDYSPAKGRVEHIQSANAGTTLQDLTYSYDKSLRMVSRTDALQPSALGGVTEHFGYDELDRLTCTSFGTAFMLGNHASVPACAVEITYQQNGNIGSKSDVGAYAYDPAHPHAVVSAGADTFGYDAAGNQEARGADTAITYTAFDLPATHTNAGKVTTFAYDGHGRRIRKATAGVETVYVGDLYERVRSKSGSGGNVAHRYYIPAGSATVVLTRVPGAAEQVDYVLTDALGSTDVVAGKTVERRSYDAFGARRNPLWGKPLQGSFTSPVTPMGFTGHEGDDDLGLVNMRGRLYDAKVGRFLMTDPILSAPSFTQSWNPYSYVRNSPLNLVDPTGFQAMGTATGQDGETYATWPEDHYTFDGPNAAVYRQQREHWDGDSRVRLLQKDANRDDTPGRTEPPGPSTGDKAKDITLGVLHGSARFTQQFFCPNPLTDLKARVGITGLETTRESLRHGSSAVEAIADGLNTANPLYHAGVTVVEIDKKAQSGDYQGAAADTTVLVATVAVTAVAVVGGGAAEGEVAQPVSTRSATVGGATYPEGSFSIVDWTGYPENIPRPEGPFRLLEGAEYDSARAAAYAENRAIIKKDGPFGPNEIHEIHTVKFGGDPVGHSNKMLLLNQDHWKVSNWWRQLEREIAAKQ